MPDKEKKTKPDELKKKQKKELKPEELDKVSGGKKVNWNSTSSNVNAQDP